MIRIIRLLGAALGALIGLGFVLTQENIFDKTGSAGFLIPVWVIAWISVGFLLLPYLTVVPVGRLIAGVQAMSTAEFLAAVSGLIVGLLIALLLGLPLAALPDPYGRYLPIGVSICFGLGMVGFTVAKREDLIAAAEASGLLRRDNAAATAKASETQVVVDTSAIIDGRIADIVDAGFLYHRLVIPHFVLEELQRIADSSDTQRRGRGRRGLEILARLQKDGPTPVEIVDDDPAEAADVDGKLVLLARARGAAILTNDFNLNRVADLQSIRVLNVNSLANALKPALLPGDTLQIKVITEGKEPGQGVGYLDDGTMVVIEGGSRLVGQELDVLVTRVLQTVMGRMVFAQVHAE
ncbi:MAG TPA: TRAM domain-containing protein [Candidatus Limnocylindrales bacterium]